MARQVADYSGMRFDKLTPVSFTRSNGSKAIIWHCVCDCGNTTKVTARKLRELKWKKLKLMCDQCKLNSFIHPKKTKFYKTLGK